MEKHRNAVLSLLTVQLLFGLFPVAAKKVFPHLDPFPLLAVRLTGAAFFLMAIHMAAVRKPIPMRDMGWKVLGLAILGVILNMSLFMVGLQYTTATEAVLVITTIPVFTYAIAVLMRREQVGPRRILGIGLALAGVVILTAGGYQHGRAHVLGDLMILGNALSYATFLVLARPVTQKYDPLSLTTWIFIFGSLVFLPLGLLTGLRGQLGAAPPATMGWLAFIILGPTVLTYLLNAVALRRVPASTVAAFTYVQPVITALLAFILLGDELELRFLPAAALVFAGVWLVARRQPKVLQGQTVLE